MKSFRARVQPGDTPSSFLLLPCDELDNLRSEGNTIIKSSSGWHASSAGAVLLDSYELSGTMQEEVLLGCIDGLDSVMGLRNMKVRDIFRLQAHWVHACLRSSLLEEGVS